MNSVNWQEIRNLLAAIDQSDVVEFSLEAQDFRLTVSKCDRGSGETAPFLPALPAATGNGSVTAASPPISTSAPASTPAEPSPPSTRPLSWVSITSPMVGTYYSAPSPGEPPFVSLGDRVSAGQTVCIIEAMKLMNELEAETSGRIVELVVENAEPVEYGQVLMYVDPSS